MTDSAGIEAHGRNARAITVVREALEADSDWIEPVDTLNTLLR